MNPIYILCPSSSYEKALASGVYAPSSLYTEGFIHASPAQQLTRVANQYYSNEPSLRLLTIDPTRVYAGIRWEPSTSGDLYPHLYGPLNLSAVVSVREFERQPDGTYTFPLSL